jgi:hypothetical protein
MGGQTHHGADFGVANWPIGQQRSPVPMLRQSLTGAPLLATVGGVLGLLLTGWGIRMFRILAPHRFTFMAV